MFEANTAPDAVPVLAFYFDNYRHFAILAKGWEK